MLFDYTVAGPIQGEPVNGPNPPAQAGGWAIAERT